ncbi:MAG: AAA family ATPase [Candidatus Cryptobacteroides sp.]
MIENVIIRNFKSIRDMELPLQKLNVLIGSNGVGKSNFISFFEMTKALFEQRLGSYTLSKGGIDNLLYRGRKFSDEIFGLMDFSNTNAFFFAIKPSQSNKGYIENTGDYFNYHKDSSKDYFGQWNRTYWDSGVEESSLVTQTKWRANYLKSYLRSFTVYHFHDTSVSSPMRGQCDINDNLFLRDNGSNLASYLHLLQKTDEKAFRMIEGTVHSIAPYFKRFNLGPDRVSASKISLEWEEVNSDMYLNGYSFSDGTIRFIALATLLLQTNLPDIIIIDEPELGLHPAAIDKLAALIKRAAKTSQIILSTQSTNLVNCFDPENIIVVDREDEQTVFKRLKPEDLSIWMNNYNYSISDMWEMNLIGGQL